MISTILRALFSGLQTHRSLVLENLALRHQVQVLSRGGRRLKLKNRDRALWVVLSRFWTGWKGAIFMVKPDTVIRWHRAGFRTYWRWKSKRRRCGRPPLTLEERALIRKMARDNPLWGSPRWTSPLRRVLDEYVAYTNESRTHLGLGKDCPVSRAIQFPDEGEIVATPVLGGLHHTYRRRAA